MRRVIPPEPRFDPIPTSGKRLLMADEIQRREAFVENLVVNRTPNQRIFLLARNPPGPLETEPGHPFFGRLKDGRPWGLGLGKAATRKIIQRVVANLNQAFEENRPNAKAFAINRIQRHVQNAARRGAFGAVASLERLTADIEGTREPLRVEIGITMQTALMSVIGSMSEKHFKALVQEYDELEAKANDGERVLVQVPKNEHRVWEVQGSQGAEYLVVEHEGVWTCNCPDFRFRGAERPCKHVDRCRPQTGLRSNGSSH